MITDRDIDIVRGLDDSGGMDARSLQQLFAMSQTPMYRRLAELERHGMVDAVRLGLCASALYVPTARGLRVLLGRQDVHPPSVTDGSYHHQLQVARALGELGALAVPWTTSRGIRRRRIDLCEVGEFEQARRFSLYLSTSRRQHLPDVAVWPNAGRPAHTLPVAVEVELSVKTKSRLDEILDAYATSVDYAGVLYVCGTAGVTRAMTRAIERGGYSSLVTLTTVDAFSEHVARLVSVSGTELTGEIG